MPRETVYNHHPINEGEPEIASGVTVSWGREGGTVQVATRLFQASDHMPVIRQVEGGWYIDLDRRGVNDLIRHLRRARDQALGRDE